MQWDASHSHSVHNVWMTQQIFNVTERWPTTSARYLATRTGTSHASVHHILQEQMLYPYHIHSVQEFVALSAPARHAFYQWILQLSAKAEVLNMDELCITGTGTTKTHYEHVWSDEYPHAIHSYHQQQQLSINQWAGITGPHIYWL
jgi:hypothetical protein